jgi:phosphatidylglycerol lysyltransferase
MNLRLVFAIGALLFVLSALSIVRRLPAIRKLSDRGGNWVGALAPRLFAITTFLAGAILLWSGATPARAGRLGWLNDVLPLPIIEFSAYFSSIAGVGLIILARALQRRLDAAYHASVWLLSAGIVFALTSNLDIEQAIALSIMLTILVPSKRFFYRKSSILEERFTPGWIAAIAVVLVGTAAIAIAKYGTYGLGPGVFWHFGIHAQGPREVRGLVLAATTLVAFAALRLLRPARLPTPLATAIDLSDAVPVVDASPHASAQLALLGDKALMFNDARNAFIMYGIAGRSWVALGDPVGPLCESVHLIRQFIERCDRAGGWPVFYRVPPQLLHLYLDYALNVVKLGEIARVSLPTFSLDGPERRNLRRVWRKAVDDGCRFEVLCGDAAVDVIPRLRPISEEWMREKRTREKRFSLGRFDDAFIRRSPVGIVRRGDEIVAFVTLWCSGERAEVESDLMRFSAAAPAGIMRYALIESMMWARDRGYAWFNLGGAPLSGITASVSSPVWNQIGLAVRGVGERYYNFQGIRTFKEWFYPEWEPTYLVSPGGTARPIILANIASLISGSARGVFRR